MVCTNHNQYNITATGRTPEQEQEAQLWLIKNICSVVYLHIFGFQV